MSDGGALGGLFAGIGTAVGAGMQARATRAAADTAADATNRATQQQLLVLNNAVNEADNQYTPSVQQGDAAARLYNAAHGVHDAGDEAALSDYEASYNNSFYNTVARDSADRSYQQLLSSNAAAGRGGQINSGKAQRNAKDLYYQANLAGRQGQLLGLGSMTTRGDAARVGKVNARLGAANTAVAAYGQQGSALANNAWNQGMASAQQWQQFGENAAGFAGYFGNAFANNNNATGGIKNATGTGLNVFKGATKPSTGGGGKSFYSGKY